MCISLLAYVILVAVLGIKRLDSIWSPIRPTKKSNGPSALINRLGVLVNASNLLRIVAGLSLSIGDIQPIGHVALLCVIKLRTGCSFVNKFWLKQGLVLL